VYLAGYAVECVLKALILSREPESKHWGVLASFRGNKAHDFDWLRRELSRRHCSLSTEIGRRLAQVNWWTTGLRYNPKAVRRKDAMDFLSDAENILHWVKGGM
jgi:HEPN domain-containing protein